MICCVHRPEPHRGLEERLGVRPLTRTTRSVSPTQSGVRLLHSVGPRFGEMEAEPEAMRELLGRRCRWTLPQILECSSRAAVAKAPHDIFGFELVGWRAAPTRHDL